MMCECEDCGYEAESWDMNYSNKRNCFVCPECESDNVKFKEDEEQINE
jgi:Zn finger protein HypA/HybF involved in hydrogenase expression